MKLTVQAGTLAAAMRRAALAADDRSTLRPLSAVRLTAADGTLAIYATDLEAGIAASVVGELEEPGEAAPRAVALRDLAEGLAPDAQVSLEHDGTALMVRAGRGRWRLPTVAVEDMPEPLAAEADAARIDIAAADLAKLLRVTFAASEEETRYYLRGVCLHGVDGALAAVACDGHRLARMLSSIETAPLPGAIVPLETIEILNKLIKSAGDRLVMRISPAVIEIAGETFLLASKLVDGTFPDYPLIIPREPRNAVTIERAELAAALERLEAIVPREGISPCVGFAWSGDALRLYLPNAGEEEITAEAVEGKAETGISLKYARELVKQHAGKHMRLATSGGPDAHVVITDPEDKTTLVVQMPMRMPPSAAAETSFATPSQGARRASAATSKTDHDMEHAS